MKRELLILLVTISISNFLSAQSTAYYKLDKIVKDGVPNTNVSGGQFITFTDKCCYESDKDGFSVNHGRMNYRFTENGVKVYSGGSYWGSSSTFLFLTDFSALNVKVNDKETYVYKKASPPKNVTTCSLIRQKSSDLGSEFVPINPVLPVNPQGGYIPVQQQSGSSTGSSSGNNSRTERQQPIRQPQKKWCRNCGGTGKCRICNGTGWVHRLGIGHDGYCASCPNHSGRCTSCNGRGEWYE